MSERRRKLFFQRWRRRIRVPLLRGILQLCAGLPLPLSHAFGALLGRLFYLFPNELRYVARCNLAVCLPQLSAAQRERLTRATLVESGKFFAEVGRVWLGTRKQFDAMVRQVHGEAHLQAALAQRKGVFIVAPHQGSWEVLGLYLSTRHPMTSMYRPPPIAALDDVVRASRQRFGATLVPTDVSGVRKLMAALKENQLIGILPDQDPGPQAGEFAPFFGVAANTMTLFTRLAQKTQAPALLCHAERLPRGQGFDIWLQPMSDAVAAQDATVALTALNAAVAALAEQRPTQYLWVYRRFRTRPPGAADIYQQ